jgi:hypothetical protein
VTLPDGLDPIWIGASIPQEHWHFHRRLWQRYWIVLGPGEFSAILRAIRRRKAVLIEKRSKKVAVYSVRLPAWDERVFVVATRQWLITVLPPKPRLRELRRVLVREHNQNK